MEPERLQLADISFIDPGIVFGKTAAEAVCSSEINQIWVLHIKVPKIWVYFQGGYFNKKK